MKYIKVIVKIFCSLIPVIIGAYLSVKDYKAALNNPEWSASLGTMWIKFGIGLVITIILLIAVFKHKN